MMVDMWSTGTFVIGKMIGLDAKRYEENQQFGTLGQGRETELYGRY